VTLPSFSECNLSIQPVVYICLKNHYSSRFKYYFPPEVRFFGGFFAELGVNPILRGKYNFLGKLIKKQDEIFL